jgi:hypothetical protein
MYGAERAVEVTTLCAPIVRSALLECGVELRSFADLVLPDQSIPSVATADPSIGHEP